MLLFLYTYVNISKCSPGIVLERRRAQEILVIGHFSGRKAITHDHSKSIKGILRNQCMSAIASGRRPWFRLG